MGQGAQQQQPGGGGDSSLGPLWIIIGLFALGLIIWYTAHTYIVALIFSLKLGEAKLVSYFTNQLAGVIAFMQYTAPSSVTFSALAQVSGKVGEFIRYPIIGILSGLAVILYVSNPTLKYRKIYSMKSLRAQEKNTWSLIAPVNSLDLIKEDVNKGSWAMAQNPMEFAARRKLLRKDDNLTPDSPLTATIKRGDAKRVFTLQLGSYWEGPENLPIHAIALCAIFMAKNQRDRSGSEKLLLQMNRSAESGKVDFSGAKDLYAKHANATEIQKAIHKHAYIYTVMAQLLVKSRDDGVLPVSEFLWLKPLDRRLWYMLNSIGRQTPFSEVAGPFAHWQAETALGRKSMVPMVDEAVKALEIAVKEVKLSREDFDKL